MGLREGDEIYRIEQIRDLLPTSGDLGRICAACVAFRVDDLVSSVRPLYLDFVPPYPLLRSPSAEPASQPQIWLGESPAQSKVSLTDDLLADIFLRLPTAADLARASSACPAFRRVITDHSFLHRFRSLHPPPLLGVLFHHFVPARPPHPSSPAASAIADAGVADFSCSFLPFRGSWCHRDFRDGRALLSLKPERRNPRVQFWQEETIVRDFAVCDPLRHRYLLLPVIPDELVAPVAQSDISVFHPFLSPACEDKEGTSFRVICLVQSHTKQLFVWAYCSRSRKWNASEFDGSSTLTTCIHNLLIHSDLSQRYYVHGCFCWATHRLSRMLVLDTRSMEFSVFNLPPCSLRVHENTIPARAIIEVGDGRFGMLTLFPQLNQGMYCLWYSVLQNEALPLSANQWHLEAVIPLPLNYTYYWIVGVAGGYLMLRGTRKSLLYVGDYKYTDWFSLNLKTFQLEWFCGTQEAIRGPKLYVGFPPPFSAPTI